MALALVLVSCRSTDGPAFTESNASEGASPDSSYPHRVTFEIGVTESVGGNSLTVTEVWGTRPEITVGGEYLVVGEYELQDADEGWINFFMTGNNWDNSGPVLPEQEVRVRRGSGPFSLKHDKRGPGWFHVELNSGRRGGHSTEVADVYFGHGDSLLTEKSW